MHQLIMLIMICVKMTIFTFLIDIIALKKNLPEINQEGFIVL